MGSLATHYSVIFTGEQRAAQLCELLPTPYVCVSNRQEFLAQVQKRGVFTVAFVDIDLLYHLEGVRMNAPVIGIIDGSPTDTLLRSVKLYDQYPWLSHVLSTSMLATPLARPHLTMLLERLLYGVDHLLLGPTGVGRAAMLARASRREARFERMHEFFHKQGMSKRTLVAISEVAEELVMNALYDAPVEAGYFKDAVPRTEDVDLPQDRACEISYAIERGTIYVRVRDPFGAFTRGRLMEVLNRCSSTGGVELDESRGGAGLGLWRVFSVASTVAITVVPGQLTDILVTIVTKDGRIVKDLLATHLFLATETNTLEDMIPDDRRDLDCSVTLVRAAS